MRTWPALALVLAIGCNQKGDGAPLPRGGVAAPEPIDLPLRFTAANVSKARAIVLRSVLRSRVTVAPGTPAVHAGTVYRDWFFLRDYVMVSAAFPGYFTSEVMRPVAELAFASIGRDPLSPTAPAEHWDLDGTPRHRSGVQGEVGRLAILDSPAYITMLSALIFERGDRSIYASRADVLEVALGTMPRSADGLLYSDPASYTVGWGFEDMPSVTGGMGMASALTAVAYRELARMADLSGDAARGARLRTRQAALIKGLATLRRQDGFYDPSTGQRGRAGMLSAFLVAEGLIPDAAERLATSRAIRDAVLAGDLVAGRHGAVRHLVAPDYYTGISPRDQMQNGAWWPGPWTHWIATACAIAGDRPLAQRLIDDAVNEIVRQHEVSGDGPWEYQSRDGVKQGSAYSNAVGALLEHLHDVEPPGSYRLATGGEQGSKPAGFVLDGGATSVWLALEPFGSVRGEVRLRGPDGRVVSTVTPAGRVVIVPD